MQKYSINFVSSSFGYLWKSSTNTETIALPLPCSIYTSLGWLGCGVVSVLTQALKAWVQIAVATLSGNCLRQTIHTHRASIHQAVKLLAALLRIAGVTAGLAESNDSLPPGLWLTSPAGLLPRTAINSRTLRSVIDYGLPLPFLHLTTHIYTASENVVINVEHRPALLRRFCESDAVIYQSWLTYLLT